MSKLRKYREACSSFISRKDVEEMIYHGAIVLIIISIGGGSFALGYISGYKETRSTVKIERTYPLSEANELGGEEGIVVASQGGTRYHYPWCSGAQQIHEENKISFPSIEAAQASGYTAAKNCKGLE